MDRWAASSEYGQTCSFVNVGCAGPQLASTFVSRLKLTHCHTTVAVRGPQWGQLGCNGFIVLDSELKVVCAATSPFNQVRELGFQHVTCLLDAITAGRKLPKICPGQFVTLHSLKAAELNHQRGVCLTSADANGRCQVALRSRKKVSVREVNLSLDAATSDPSDSDEEEVEEEVQEAST